MVFVSLAMNVFMGMFMTFLAGMTIAMSVIIGVFMGAMMTYAAAFITFMIILFA